MHTSVMEPETAPHAPPVPTRTAAASRRRPAAWATRLAWIAAGACLALFTVLDSSSLAYVLGFPLALAAHGSLAVLVLMFIDVVHNQRRHKDGRRKWKWSAVRSAVFGAVFGLVLVEIDRFVLNLAVPTGWKWVYFVSMWAAFAVVLAWELACVLSARHVDHRVLKVLGERIITGVKDVAVGIGVVLLVLGGLAWRNQRDVDDHPISPQLLPAAMKSYVALGDSYSAGEGLGPFLPGPHPGCHRSPDAYPMVLAHQSRIALTFDACSGAVTEDVDKGIVGGFDPQIGPGVHRDVDLVTITIGGNDVIFSRVVQACFLYENCINATFIPPPASRARPTIVYPKASTFATWASKAMGVLVRNVDRVYAKLRTSYPNARVVVLGYPYLFPDGGAPWWPSDCVAVLRRVDGSERAGLRRLTDRLNNVLYERATLAHLDFVSPAAAWDGHEPCGRKGQYTTAIKPVLHLLNPVDGGTFHPNRQGQRQLARLVACYLSVNPHASPTYLAHHPPGSLLPRDASTASDCSNMVGR